MGMFGGHGLIGLIIGIVLLVVPAWKIVEKAGYPGPLALLVLVPVVNVVALWLFAFSAWPRGGR
ncbi:hypothetical protein KGA65_03175 [Ideonella sp. B7]|uniref:hypothetical protein n=1 Tax=Ideonella benzenivorans TaxID=2831643 RepID=UPI001CED65CC|nr:hypothetical protein [Ideonella benzenivorans]MCA6215539.1 hypothetical protein [Ideonella benzenivorans]